MFLSSSPNNHAFNASRGPLPKGKLWEKSGVCRRPNSSMTWLKGSIKNTFMWVCRKLHRFWWLSSYKWICAKIIEKISSKKYPTLSFHFRRNVITQTYHNSRISTYWHDDCCLNPSWVAVLILNYEDLIHNPRFPYYFDPWRNNLQFGSRKSPLGPTSP